MQLYVRVLTLLSEDEIRSVEGYSPSVLREMSTG
jgi:hypothetical protein